MQQKTKYRIIGGIGGLLGVYIYDIIKFKIEYRKYRRTSAKIRGQIDFMQGRR